MVASILKKGKVTDQIYYRPGLYSCKMSDVLKKGDYVIYAVPRSAESRTGEIAFFRLGTVIFSNPYYATIEMECKNPITGEVLDSYDDGKHVSKIRYTVDQFDVAYGVVRKCELEHGIPVTSGGFNTMQLNSAIKRGTVIKKTGISSACAAYVSAMG